MRRDFDFNPTRSNAAVGLSEPSNARSTKFLLRPLRKFALSGLMFTVLGGAAVLSVPANGNAAEISIGISLRVGPPPIPVYTQPPCPGEGFMWTPGYWSFDPDEGYYWVPGTWVEIPEPGMYWTPGYWGWGGEVFVWHAGYWGPHVGYYGGIDYGFGYGGVGFVGGEWRGRNYYYNRSVTNITEVHVTNVYYRNEPRNFGGNRVSYNGGQGGINYRPNREELNAQHDRHMQATTVQHQNQVAAQRDRGQFANSNHGTPGVAAARRPGEFHGAGAVAPTRAGGAYNPGNPSGGNNRNPGFSNNQDPKRNPGSAGGFHQPGSPAANPAGNPAANPGGNPAVKTEQPSRFPGNRNPGAAGGEVHNPPAAVGKPGGNPNEQHGGYSRYHDPNGPGQPQSNVSRGPQNPTPRVATPEQPKSPQYGQYGQPHASPTERNIPTNNPPQHNAPISAPQQHNAPISMPPQHTNNNVGHGGGTGGPPPSPGNQPHPQPAPPQHGQPQGGGGGGHQGHGDEHHH